jgi:hypothetical protein
MNTCIIENGQHSSDTVIVQMNAPHGIVKACNMCTDHYQRRNDLYTMVDSSGTVHYMCE